MIKIVSKPAYSSTIATSIVHSKLVYCNSLFLNLESAQLKRLQLIQNSLARAVTRTPKHRHITPILKSLHWLKMPERIHFKVLSLTYNSLQYSKPSYLRDLFTIQPTRSTRSSSVLTLSRPPVTTHLKFSNRALSSNATRLWNDLPPEFRTFSVPPPSALITYHYLPQAPLSITPKTFHSKLKSLLFNNSYPADQKMFDELCGHADSPLFSSVLHNPSHVLNCLLPPVKNVTYSLRTRSHNREIPHADAFTRCGFITRMLFNNDYTAELPSYINLTLADP